MARKTAPMAPTGARTPGDTGPTRRLPPDRRRSLILAAAADAFARDGFDIPTRALAARLGITQALLYRYFPSKEALIRAVLEHALGGEADALAIDDAPAAEALDSYYRRFVGGMTETRTRLFVRAGLDGREWPTRRGGALTRTVFQPAIAALRREAGLPGLDARPAMRGERELMMMLHAAMVFFGIRRHVYGMPMPSSLDDVVSLQVRSFVAGALPTLRALHADGPESLTVELVGRSAERPTRPGRRRISRR